MAPKALNVTHALLTRCKTGYDSVPNQLTVSSPRDDVGYTAIQGLRVVQPQPYNIGKYTPLSQSTFSGFDSIRSWQVPKIRSHSLVCFP